MNAGELRSGRFFAVISRRFTTAEVFRKVGDNPKNRDEIEAKKLYCFETNPPTFNLLAETLVLSKSTEVFPL